MAVKRSCKNAFVVLGPSPTHLADFIMSFTLKSMREKIFYKPLPRFTVLLACLKQSNLCTEMKCHESGPVLNVAFYMSVDCHSSKHNLLDIMYELGSAFKSNIDLQSCIRVNLHLMHLIGQFELASVKSNAYAGPALTPEEA